MCRSFAGGLLLMLGLGAQPAAAALLEGRSVGLCSERMQVCAFMKDGTATSTSECRAQSGGAVRIVPGDCDDAD